MLARLHPLGPVSATVLLVALSLTGCTSEPSIRPATAIPAATTAPPPTPTAAPPTAAPEDPRDASLRVVRAYMDAYGPGFRAGDGSALMALATEACTSCSGAAENFSEWRDFSATRAGGNIVITSAEVDGAPAPTTITWRVSYRQEAMTYTAADGTTKNAADVTAGDVYFEIVLSDRVWRINAIREEVKENRAP